MIFLYYFIQIVKNVDEKNVYTNGNILTIDSHFPERQAVLVKEFEPAGKKKGFLLWRHYAA